VTHSLLAPDGFSANQLRRLIENFGWLLHFSTHDDMLFLIKGDARSAFPERTPQAWIL
jgi:hypothetical protein